MRKNSWQHSRKVNRYIHTFGWGGSAHLAPCIKNYVILPNRSKVHAHTRKVPFVWGGRAQLAPFVGQCGVHTQCGGWRCSYKRQYLYDLFAQQCHSCSSVPHNVKTSERISMQLTSTDSGTDCSDGPVECGSMLPGWVSFGPGTWSNSVHIRGGLTWLGDESAKKLNHSPGALFCKTHTPSAINRKSTPSPLKLQTAYIHAHAL